MRTIIIKIILQRTGFNSGASLYGVYKVLIFKCDQSEDCSQLIEVIYIYIYAGDEKTSGPFF